MRQATVAIARTRWGQMFQLAWERMGDERGTMSRQEFWVFASTVLGAFAATCLVFGGPLLLLPDRSTMPALVPVGLFSIYASIAGLVVLTTTLVAASKRVRESTGHLRYVLLGLLNPLLLGVLLLSPPIDRRRVSALGDDYFDVWRKFADYDGVSTRREFYRFTGITAGLVVTLLVGTLTVANLFDDGAGHRPLPVAWASVLFAIFVVLGAQVAWLPLAVRRTRDAYGEEPDENARLFIPIALQFPVVGMPMLFAVWCILCLRPSRNPDGDKNADVAKRDAGSGLPRRRREANDPIAPRPDDRRGPVATRHASQESFVPSHRSRYDPRFHRASRNRSHRRNLGDGSE